MGEANSLVGVAIGAEILLVLLFVLGELTIEPRPSLRFFVRAIRGG